MSQRTRLIWQTNPGCAAAVPPHPVPRYAEADRPGAEKPTETQAPILVVEDDFLVAMQIEAALTEAGFALSGTAASGEEAVSMVASVRPALVLMDIRLAGKMDGVEAALMVFQQY